VSDTLRYGYDYPCQGADADTPAAADVDLCRLQPVAFQDVSCSDAAGAQRCYFEIMARKWCSNCLVNDLPQWPALEQRRRQKEVQSLFGSPVTSASSQQAGRHNTHVQQASAEQRLCLVFCLHHVSSVAVVLCTVC
jgi:hypothetical protein